MRIVSAASAFPKHYYPQQTLTAALKQYWGDKIKQPGLVDKLHGNMGIDGRHTVLPLEEYLPITRWGQANDIWIEKAEELGQQAICRALTSASISPRDIDALFFTSITGVSSPSIDARLVNRMKLSPRIRRTPIFGLGCVGGAAGISRAADYVRAYPHHVAVLLSVEICSLTLQRDDLSIANLISSGLFGDGAAAVVLAGADCELPGPEIIDSRSSFYPGTQDVMGWDISEEGFRIVLSAGVPDMVKLHLADDVDGFLDDHGMTRADIASWIFHTGGPKVLEATEDALALHNGELHASWEALRRTGNLSSASVLVVLEDVMRRHRPDPGTYSILAAMGPGFCAELVLIRW
jgi:alkylresorcinol/alkylpyrone synthase